MLHGQVHECVQCLIHWQIYIELTRFDWSFVEIECHGFVASFDIFLKLGKRRTHICYTIFGLEIFFYKTSSQRSPRPVTTKSKSKRNTTIFQLYPNKWKSLRFFSLSLSLSHSLSIFFPMGFELNLKISSDLINCLREFSFYFILLLSQHKFQNNSFLFYSTAFFSRKTVELKIHKSSSLLTFVRICM